MRIEIVQRTSEEKSKCEDREALVIRVNGKDFMSFYDGEPEDNTLSRNFSDIFRIEELINNVIEALKDGELVVISNSESADI